MKSTRLKTVLAASFCILAAVILGIAAKLYVIGEPVDGNQLYCTTATDGQAMELRVCAVESGVALRDWKMKREGGHIVHPGKESARIPSVLRRLLSIHD